jgi:LmbE family N-acetylglucosaminyl deacetylase
MKNKTILVIGAHPDDPEFGCGGTVAKYISEGATAYYLICTNGARGSRNQDVKSENLAEQRKKEQENAAKIIGVKEVFFLDHGDGELEADLSLKEEIVKIIRKLKPDIVFTHDPSWFYYVAGDFAFVNHTDHRETGAAAIDAVFPLARDLSSFPEHINEGLEPHKVLEVYLFNWQAPTYLEDISDFFEIKYKAILEHKSQIDNPKNTRRFLEQRLGEIGKKANCKFAEGFVKLTLK